MQTLYKIIWIVVIWFFIVSSAYYLGVIWWITILVSGINNDFIPFLSIETKALISLLSFAMIMWVMYIFIT